MGKVLKGVRNCQKEMGAETKQFYYQRFSLIKTYLIFALCEALSQALWYKGTERRLCTYKITTLLEILTFKNVIKEKEMLCTKKKI